MTFLDSKKDLEELIKGGIATTTTLLTSVLAYTAIKFDEMVQPGMESSPFVLITKFGFLGIAGLSIYQGIQNIKSIEKSEKISYSPGKDHLSKLLFGVACVTGTYGLYKGEANVVAVSGLYGGGIISNSITNKLASIYHNMYGSKNVNSGNLKTNVSEGFEKLLEGPATNH